MFKKKTLLFILFVFFILFFQKTNSKEIKNNIIVSVNNLIITELDLTKEIKFIQFINKYVEMMELHGLTNTVNKKKKTGRKLPEEAKIVGKLQNELYELQEELKELGDKNYELTISIKEKKGELDRSSEALKETIENELKELEASYIETRNKIVENEIVKKDVEERLIRAEKLTTLLYDEGKRWVVTSESLK